MESITLRGSVIIPGEASGEALISHEPLSFWGGYDWRSGEITDRRHALSGAIATNRILGLPFTRGSSTTTAVLLEAIRNKTAPRAIITTATDFFLALASVVAEEMYASPLPLVFLTEAGFARLKTGDRIQITKDGRVVINR